MVKREGATDSEIKAAIKAAQSAFKDQERLHTSLSQRARLLSLRRKLGERLQPVFAEAGLDIEKINRILAEHQHEELSLLEEEKSKTTKTFEALSENLRRGIENRKKAQEHLAFKHPIVTSVPLWTAYDITEDPGDLPFVTHIEESNNLAKTFFDKSTDGSASVHVNFWFYWQNPTEYLAVLSNVESDLVLFGTCAAFANPHLFVNAETLLEFYARLTGYTAEGRVPGNLVYIGAFYVKGDHIGGTVNISSGVFSDTYHLSGPSWITVSPGLGVSFAVDLQIKYSIDRGRVKFDFDSPGHFIRCPGVQMDLLTPPA